MSINWHELVRAGTASQEQLLLPSCLCEEIAIRVGEAVLQEAALVLGALFMGRRIANRGVFCAVFCARRCAAVPLKDSMVHCAFVYCVLLLR